MEYNKREIKELLQREKKDYEIYNSIVLIDYKKEDEKQTILKNISDTYRALYRCKDECRELDLLGSLYQDYQKLNSLIDNNKAKPRIAINHIDLREINK